MSYLSVGVLGMSLLAANPLYQPLYQTANSNGFLVAGEASRSCEQYLKAAEAERAARPPDAPPGMRYTSLYVIFVGVTDGFLTGVNYIDQDRPQIGEVSDAHSRMTWLETYCKAHPSASFVEALQYLRLELIKKGT